MPFQTKLYKLATLVLAILFVSIGGYVLFYPYEFIVTAFHILALGLISLGVVELAYSFFSRNVDDGMLWKITRNLLNIVFGILLVRYKFTAAIASVMLMGTWFFFLGSAKVIFSVRMKKYGIFNWAFGLTIGGLGMVLGIIAFFTPHFWALVTAYVMGVALIFLGLVFASEFFILNYFS